MGCTTLSSDDTSLLECAEKQLEVWLLEKGLCRTFWIAAISDYNVELVLVVVEKLEAIPNMDGHGRVLVANGHARQVLLADTTSTSTSSSSGAEKAPNYAAAAAGNIRSEGELKPKGENLTEGDIPQTKTFTGDVGGPNDPGRVALQGFQKVSAQNAASAGSEHHAGSGNSADVNTGNKFDVLESERA